MFNLLVVEDNIQLQTILKKQLNQEGYDVLVANNGRHALEVLENHSINLMISDVMMPLMDGNHLIEAVRHDYPDLPIIILTALESIHDKEKSFLKGTDDYLTKPVNIKELKLRIKALLRRSSQPFETFIKHKEILLKYKEKQCLINDQIIDLKLKEFELLYKLISESPRILTRSQLMDDIWGYDSESFERTIDTHIKSLRKKILSPSLEIMTIRGLGYKVNLL